MCQQSLADSLGEKPRVELKSARRRFTTTGNTDDLLARTPDGAGDFQLTPKGTGLQRSVISVG